MSERPAKTRLRRYATAMALWGRGFDTASIAALLKLPEPLIERWVWNFREQARLAA